MDQVLQCATSEVSHLLLTARPLEEVDKGGPTASQGIMAICCLVTCNSHSDDECQYYLILTSSMAFFQSWSTALKDAYFEGATFLQGNFLSLSNSALG